MPGRSSGTPIAFWTGTSMLVWGGAALWASNTPDKPDGASYDPVRHQWSPITTKGALPTRDLYIGAWTGTRLLIWGGRHCNGDLYHLCRDGGSYDPALDTWGPPMSTTGAPQPRFLALSAWTGRQMLVWGGVNEAGVTIGDGARYDPATDQWRPIATAGAPSPRGYAANVWTGTEWLVWGGSGGSPDNRIIGDGARYDPATDQWRPITTVGAPSHRYVAEAIWTGTEMIVWGGLGCEVEHIQGPLPSGVSDLSPVLCRDGARYDPMRDAWRPMSTHGAPSPRSGSATVWTGRVMVVWGGATNTCGGEDSHVCGDGAAYDPSTDTWASLSTAGAPSPRASPAVVWTGTQMLLWSGFGGDHDVAGTATWTP